MEHKNTNSFVGSNTATGILKGNVSDHFPVSAQLIRAKKTFLSPGSILAVKI